MISDPLLLRAALDAMPGALMVTGADGTICWVNEAFTRLTGYSAQEAVGQTPRLLKSGAQDAAFYEALWKGALAGGWEGELLNRRRDGTLYWERQSIAAIRAPSGEISHFVASKTDVTQWRAARERNEHLPVAYMAVDPEGRIVAVNRAWSRMLGYTPEESVGRPFSELVPPDQAGDFRDCFDEFRKLGGIRCVEGALLRKNGERVPVVVQGDAEYGAGKRFLRGHMTFEDATERRRAERTLRFTQSAVSNAPDASYWIAHDGRIVYVNDAACRMLGYTRDELLSMTLFDIDPELPPGVFGRPGPRIETGESCLERRHRRKDGRLVPVEVNCNAAAFDGEEYFCSFVRDVTARKRAESALRQSEERFRSLVENAPEAVFVVAGGLFRYLNPAACALYGAESPEQLLGQPAIERIHPDHREMAADRIRAVVRKGSAAPLLEEKHLRLDGSLADVEVVSAPFDFQGEAAAIVFAHDIGSRKLAEEERARLAEQLRQSQRLESIGRLAGGVAHDFNNLLTVINGYADLLLMRAEDALRPALEQIRKSGERAAQLTQQLLAFSRRQDAQLRPTDLNAVIRDARESIERLAGERVRLAVRLADSLGLAMADAGQMRQAVTNLVANAREAMPSGGDLLIETANLEVDPRHAAAAAGVAPGPYVTLTVTDTGCGMDEETRRSVFEPFFTTKEKGQGAGLGLPTVYGIVKQSGGWVHVVSEPGRGTTLKIYLPKLSESAAPPEPPAQPQFAALRGTETILLVEDQEEVRKLALEVLTGYGYQLLEAANGAEALDLAKRYSGTIDLLLTDVVMPIMNGRELVERLSPLRPAMRILYMSGYAEDVMARNGVLDPEVAYLPKPFAPERLAAKVRRTLDAPTPQRA